MDEFNKEDLEFFLPDQFKGLSKKYLIDCIFNEEIQKNWMPGTGDIIIGCTGNIFVIGNVENLHSSIGGRTYYYGGAGCNRSGGCAIDSTYCYTANESGIYYHPIKGEQPNSYHSSIRSFRYVPYPHEINK